MHLERFNEDYLISLPSLHIEGLIYGSPFVELNRSTYIRSSTGYTARVDYSGKGWVSGKKNSFTAILHADGREKDPLYTIDGQWSDRFVIKEGKHNKVVGTYQARDHPTTPLIVAPLDRQDPLESRRAWHQVATAILKGDLDKTGAEKSLIENQQRDLRRLEQQEGREWERRFFVRVDHDPVFDALASRIGERSEPEKTGGIWRWDPKKASQLSPSTNPDRKGDDGASSSLEATDGTATTTTTTTTSTTTTSPPSRDQSLSSPSVPNR